MKVSWNSLVVSIIFVITLSTFVMGNDLTKPEYAVILTVNGAIGPATLDYIQTGFNDATMSGASLIVIEMDTPGGLDRSMRDIIQLILASSVPVVTYVSPSGARAASAGTYILYASHIAAMAPGTNLGAATPVSIAPEQKSDKQPTSIKDLLGTNETPTSAPTQPVDAKMTKAVNDATAYIKSLADLRGRNAEWAQQAVKEGVSLAANDALKQHVIDIVADDLDDLFAQLDGRVVMIDDQLVTIQATTLERRIVKPTLRQRILAIVSSPDLAYMLLIAGAYGLFLEFSNPGIMIAGIAGSIAILVAFYALHLFPIQYAGLALIVLGLGLFIGEIITPTFGVMTLGGTIAFIIGSFFLIDTSSGFPGISLHLILIFTTLNVILIGLISWVLFKALRKPSVTGVNALIGVEGTVVSITDDMIQVKVHGDIWQATCIMPLQQGMMIRVVGVDNLTLMVEPGDV